MEPEKGVHKYTLGGFAAVDTIGTAIISVIIAYKLSYTSIKCVILSLLIFVLLVLISIPIHMLFGINTRLVRKYRKEK